MYVALYVSHTLVGSNAYDAFAYEEYLRQVDTEAPSL